MDPSRLIDAENNVHTIWNCASMSYGYDDVLYRVRSNGGSGPLL